MITSFSLLSKRTDVPLSNLSSSPTSSISLKTNVISQVVSIEIKHLNKLKQTLSQINKTIKLT
jgi:hypothetical protein